MGGSSYCNTKYFKDGSREFDEFRVNTSTSYSSLQAALLVLVTYRTWVSFYQEGSYFLFTIMVSAGIFTLSGEF